MCSKFFLKLERKKCVDNIFLNECFYFPVINSNFKDNKLANIIKDLPAHFFIPPLAISTTYSISKSKNTFESFRKGDLA